MRVGDETDRKKNKERQRADQPVGRWMFLEKSVQSTHTAMHSHYMHSHMHTKTKAEQVSGCVCVSVCYT